MKKKEESKSYVRFLSFLWYTTEKINDSQTQKKFDLPPKQVMDIWWNRSRWEADQGKHQHVWSFYSFGKMCWSHVRSNIRGLMKFIWTLLIPNGLIIRSLLDSGGRVDQRLSFMLIQYCEQDGNCINYFIMRQTNVCWRKMWKRDMKI